MKKLIILTGIISLTLSSCYFEDSNPTARFSVNYDLVEPGELVSFTNNSYDAYDYFWEFGDGNTSNLAHPSHYYRNEGIYEVRLTAYNGSRSDVTYMYIEVYETTLEVIVKDYETDELVPYTDVILYGNYQDWLDDYYRLGSGTTGQNGTIVFTGLEAKSYSVYVENSQYINYGLGERDQDLVVTKPLAHASHNVFIAYAFYDPVTGMQLKSTEDGRNLERTLSKKELDEKLTGKKTNLQYVKKDIQKK